MPSKLNEFTEFLKTVELKRYRKEYASIKIVEMDLPKDIQAIVLLYKIYWEEKRFIPFEEFYEHYHKRSNVETTFAMIKQKFSGQLMTKNWQANTNEILGKCICHNIYCLIKAYYLLNVEKTISTEVLNKERIQVLL